MGVEQVCQIETGFLVLQYDNSTSSEQAISREVDINCIQFHFCFKGCLLYTSPSPRDS